MQYNVQMTRTAAVIIQLSHDFTRSSHTTDTASEMTTASAQWKMSTSSASLITKNIKTKQATFAQEVTLTFTGKDASDLYCQLDSVCITNLTQHWQTVLYWPDTTLIMQNGTSVTEHSDKGTFGLSQNNPNPFCGTTDVNLTVTEPGAVTLEITDINGRTVETWCTASLQYGAASLQNGAASLQYDAASLNPPPTNSASKLPIPVFTSLLPAKTDRYPR